MNKSQTVFVGLSGGVDSSVAAGRLLRAGYNVVGVFIKVWHPDFMVCNWEQERLDAMRVAAHFNIPFLTCDAVTDYKKEVADYFISEYKNGRTPNPDVLCNQNIKFGAFLRFAKDRGADFIATGHYAEKIDGKLYRGKDHNKDQSYFLWTLTDDQLKYVLFPVGDTPKENIRLEAKAMGVPTAQKKDSQGICFLGQVDIPEFLSHYIDLKVGDVLNEAGEVIGKHRGAFVYTNGQRHGFTLQTEDANRQPVYVIDRDIINNTITVSSKRPIIDLDSKIELTSVVLRDKLNVGDKIDSQFRYRQKPFTVEIISIDETGISLNPITPIEKPAVGQSCVLYRGDECLGGGIIS